MGKGKISKKLIEILGQLNDMLEKAKDKQNKIEIDRTSLSKESIITNYKKVMKRVLILVRKIVLTI